MGKEDCGMIFTVAAAILLALVLLAMVRVLLGPSMPDRVVGIDTANTLMVSALLVIAAMFNQIIFVDVAIVYAMLSFVGTLFFAKYLEGAK